MSDAIVRLLFNTNDYDKKLDKAKNSTNSFASSIKSSAVGALTKFAGVIGVAMGAQEAFERVIRGSQTTSDEYDRIMRSVNTTIDSFFTAVSTGDFTTFDAGLSAMIAKAREANDALDQLWNTATSYNYFNAKNQALFAEQIAILRDKGATEEQKKAAKEIIEGLLKDQKEITNVYAERSKEAISALVVEGNTLDASMITPEVVEKVLRLDVKTAGNDLKAQLADKYEEYKKLAEKAKIESYITREMPGGGRVSAVDPQLYKRKLASLNAEYLDAITYNEVLVKKNDEWLKKLTDIQVQASNAERSYAGMVKTYNRAVGSIVDKDEETKKDNKKKKEDVPKGSLAWYDEAISKKQMELKLAIDQESRTKLMNDITSLEREKRIIEFEYKFPNQKAPYVEKSEDIAENYDSLSNTAKNLNKDWNKIGKIETPINKKDVTVNKDYAESLSMISDSFGMLNNSARNMNNDFLSFITGSFASIAQMIIQLEALTKAQALAGAASLPFPASLAAFATVVSTITSIFSSLPKFANGGIVDGTSYFGDKMIARVNSGEMILNQSQQGRLFKLIDSGRRISGNLPTEGKVTVNGKDLYIAIKNYMRSTNKKW